MAVSILVPLKAISRLALAGGQGSTICTILLVAMALPPVSATSSRRSRYSEQPASVVSSAAMASARMLLDGRIGDPPRQIEHVSGERPRPGSRDARDSRRHSGRLRPRDFGLAEQEHIGVVGRQAV